MYLDVNVVVDYFLRRDPWYESARTLLELGKLGSITLGVAASTVPYLCYKVVRDKHPLNTRDRLEGLASCVEFVTLDDRIVRDAISSVEPDLEDGIQLAMATRWRVDLLLTRDQRAFKRTSIRKLSPLKFLGDIMGEA